MRGNSDKDMPRTLNTTALSVFAFPKCSLVVDLPPAESKIKDPVTQLDISRLLFACFCVATTHNSEHLAFSSVYLQSTLSLFCLSMLSNLAEGLAATASGIADSADLANLLDAPDPSAMAIY